MEGTNQEEMRRNDHDQRQLDNEGDRADHFTAAAVTKVGELIAAAGADEPLALRVAVKPGGCSGFNYDMYFDSETPTTTDDVPSAASRSSWTRRAPNCSMGSTLDFTDGLQGAGFHITNPNASRTCGCGNSFS